MPQFLGFLKKIDVTKDFGKCSFLNFLLKCFFTRMDPDPGPYFKTDPDPATLKSLDPQPLTCSFPTYTGTRRQKESLLLPVPI
jgi:hypothetical protein